MNAIQWVAAILLAMAAIPFVVYLSVKLGTYAFFRGRQLFQEDQKRNQTNGKN